MPSAHRHTPAALRTGRILAAPTNNARAPGSDARSSGKRYPPDGVRDAAAVGWDLGAECPHRTSSPLTRPAFDDQATHPPHPTMDYSESFRLVNLGTGGLMVFAGIYHIFPIYISHFIIGVYVAILGAAVVLLEFQIPPQIARYASFLFSFVGRGAFYIFAGAILLDDHIINIIFGSIIALIGAAYVILGFIPSIEPPQNMREADAGWGAETV
ncbi:hypothetical protein K3495_g2195 [Podosphaera aphanis]|nr:hypothetical protein K3495_g2195 [Podosphaera aphanis]